MLVIQAGSQEQTVTQWRFEDIRDLRRRRFCLQDRAVEVFSTGTFPSPWPGTPVFQVVRTIHYARRRMALT